MQESLKLRDKKEKWNPIRNYWAIQADIVAAMLNALESQKPSVDALANVIAHHTVPEDKTDMAYIKSQLHMFTWSRYGIELQDMFDGAKSSVPLKQLHKDLEKQLAFLKINEYVPHMVSRSPLYRYIVAKSKKDDFAAKVEVIRKPRLD